MRATPSNAQRLAQVRTNPYKSIETHINQWIGDEQMTVKELADLNLLTLSHLGENAQTQISVPFCCDLLSIAMGRRRQAVPG